MITVELISIGESLSEPMVAASKALNTVQGEFRFVPIPEARNLDGLTFRRDVYTTSEVWYFLEAYRTRVGGPHPYILAFVNRPLSSERLANLFGSHNADRGLAVATLDGHLQFVSDPKRYMAYYMVRYLLSFLAPELKSHSDHERKDCYFHKKIFKPDIKDSMRSGKICDSCQRELDRRTSPEQRQALQAIRDVVSGQYPYALIMKGGGIKGLAFAGALLELERHFSFDTFSGTSAGAITAVLLGAGYTPTELRQTLADMSFRTFLNASRLRSAWNLITTYGLYSGDAFESWVRDLLSKKLKAMGRIEMKHLRDSIIYACTPGHGTVVFDSRGSNKDVEAAFAARCSMSIPFFFKPMTIEQRRVYDGGMRNNFPVARFLADNPGKPFIALYLGEPLGFRKPQFIFAELLDIWLGGEELAIVDSHRDSVAVIDPKPISTLKFSLTRGEADFLVKAGRAAAMRLALQRRVDSAPTGFEVEEAEREVETLRVSLMTTRAARRKRWIWFTLVVLATAVAFYFRQTIVTRVPWPF